MGRLRKGVAQTVLGKLEQTIEERRARGEYLQERLRAIDDLQVLQMPVDSRPAYPWLPMLFRQSEVRNEAYRRLRSSGLGPSKLFTRSLNRYDYLADIVPQGHCPGAEYVAARILTLPTHRHVTKEDMDRMVKIISECL